MQTIIYRMNKQQGPSFCTAENYIQYPMIKHNGKEYEKMCVCMYTHTHTHTHTHTYITESLACTAEIDTTL